LAIGLGADAINKATNLGPMNVANWNVRGFFYQNLIGIEGAENQALASYRRAIQLEPSSPYSFAEIARVYILLAQNYTQKGEEEKKTENLNSAIDALNKALQLKPDYPVANYLFAVALDQLGKLDEAIQKLEATKNLAPQDFGVRFQLGMLYWRKGELEKAKTQFEEAVAINPDYSNARYMLGLIFDKIGEKEKAKEEFEIVAKLNPENQEVKKILENLEKGLPALEGITQSQQPIGETPPEIKK
jgi:Tfp pilus assembly protein PilF